MKLAGLRKFIGENIGSVTKNVLPGTALSAGFGMLAGGPTAGLTYAATDVLGSLPATMLGRYAARNIKSPGTRNAIEGVANVAGSIGGSILGSQLLTGSQQQQIAQQIEQRSVVNDLPLASQISELSPGTQYQLNGLPSSQPFEQLLSHMPRNSWTQYLSPEDQAMLRGVINPRL